jgi:regulatory protein
MLVTRILKVRRERNRFEVYLDDQAAFRVSATVLAKHGLYKGQDLQEDAVGKIVQADAQEQAHQTAVNFISYRPRSSKEVLDKLVRKGFDSDLAVQVVDRLRELMLINDLEFARMFVRDKLRGKPMGRALLRKKLLEKGISFQLAERILNEYITAEHEQEAARALAERKFRTSRKRFSGLEPATQQKRLADYLLNRGFSAEVAYKTVRTIIR